MARYSEDQVTRWYARYQDGLTLNQVAREFGVAQPTVLGEFVRRGWPRRPKGWRPVTASPRWAAVVELPAERPPGILERDWRVLLARRGGQTQSAIARDLGVSSQRVGQLEGRALRQLAGSGPAEASRATDGQGAG